MKGPAMTPDDLAAAREIALKVLPPTADVADLRYATERIAAHAQTARAAGEAAALEPGVAEIAAERRRQREVEGWTEAHDDEHSDGSMALAAGCYALYAGGFTDMDSDEDGPFSQPPHWPWDCEWWKPSTPLRNLEKAGALIAAEIAKIKRSLSPQGGPDGK